VFEQLYLPLCLAEKLQGSKDMALGVPSVF
jgi:hypothetical protein